MRGLLLPLERALILIHRRPVCVNARPPLPSCARGYRRKSSKRHENEAFCWWVGEQLGLLPDFGPMAFSLQTALGCQFQTELMGRNLMNSSAEPKMSDSIQQFHIAAPVPSLPKGEKEPGHPCSGEGRCCGGCKNPKRPSATQAEQLSGSSENTSQAEHRSSAARSA